MVRACSTLGRDEKYKISVRKPEGKRSLKGPGRRWEDNRMVVMKIGWEVVGWMHLAKDRDQWRAPVNTVMNLRSI